jgi:hypothetical protein
MSPRDPRSEHRGVDPACNDTRTDRWLNFTSYTAPTPGAARPNVEVRPELQHHLGQLRRKAWSVVAVAAAVMITITVAVSVAQARSDTRCARPVPATVMAVTP